LTILLCLDIALIAGLFWLYVIQGRSKIDVHISINNANGTVFISWFDLKNIDLKLIFEDLDGYSIALMQAGEVS